MPVSARLALPLATLLVLLPASARADRGEFLVAAEPSFALIHVDGRNAWGGGTGLDLEYSVTDSLAVRATGAFTAHDLPANMTLPGGLLTAWHAGAGLTYSLDVLRLVPYFDVSVGLLGKTQPVRDMSGKTSQKASYDFGFEIGLGLDYLITRTVAVGFVVRYHAYLTAITDIPVYLYAGPRIAFRFGGW